MNDYEKGQRDLIQSINKRVNDLDLVGEDIIFDVLAILTTLKPVERKVVHNAAD